MSVPEDYFCLDGDVANGINPFRPGIDTLGGVDKVNDVPAPDPITMPTAPEYNQRCYAIAGASRVAPLASIVIRIVSGEPTVFAVLAQGTLLTTASFTVTAAADGNFAVTAPATAIPGPLFGGLDIQSTSNFKGTATPNGGGNGLEVRTWNSSNTLADVDCVVHWF